MENTSQRLKDLLHSASWSRADKIWLEQYLAGDVTELESIAKEAFQQNSDGLTPALSKEESVLLLNNLHQRLSIDQGRRIQQARKTKLWPRIVAAAAVAAIVFGIWFFSASRHPDAGQDLAHVANDIAPGKNTATLTLANGKMITLSDAKTGVVVNAKEMKYNDGTVVDKQLSPSGGTEPFASSTRQKDNKNSELNAAGRGGRETELLTAATPRGGTYQFTLPDGTQVWLNAASKISFPSQFSGTNRKILLSGEAYFEVAKDSKHPFVVQSDGQDVTVLGTHFNINAYPDESGTKTTLLEGSVRIDGKLILKPGEQATNTNSTIKVTEIDPTTAIAWKNGLFSFKDADIQTVMRQMARWYDVEIEYEGAIPKTVLTGKMYRNLNASEVLKLLDFYQIKHRIINKKIIISN